MISYEELCESLERYKRRQSNQAELDRLERDPAPARRREAAVASETFSLKPGRHEESYSEPPEDTHEIDVDDMVEDDR